jgi:pimeloyl-ACP methyl ester carboxylesterase
MPRRLLPLVAFALAVAACTPSGDTTPTVTGAPPTTPSTSAAPDATTTTTGAPTRGYTPVFEQDTCRFAEPRGREITCGFVTVPEDRDEPGGNRVRIAVAIVKAEVGPTADDPIFYLDGGPGGESLEPLEFTFDRVFQPFAQTRDLVFFDQRGIGLSEPNLDCVEDLDLTYELLDDDLPNAEFLARQYEAIQACRDRLVADGIDLSHYNSATNAADVADIRIALGYDEINLLGISYGTRLAQTVMRDHPEGIRSVVLDSVYTPDVDLAVSTPANLDRALDELFEGCADSSECAELYPDLEPRFFALVEELDGSPLLIQASDFLTGDEYDVIVDGAGLLGVVFQGLYSEEIIPTLPQLIDEVEQGQTATLSQLVSINLSNVPFISVGMHLSVQCAEEIPFSDPADVDVADDSYPGFGDFFETAPTIGPPVFELCSIWDVPALGAVENEAVSSDIPTLVLAGEYDPITPPEWGRRVTATLRNSRFLLAPGLGHGVSLGSDCTALVSLAFIEDPTGSLDTACIDELPPPVWAGTPSAVVGFELVATEIAAFGVVIDTLRPDTWTEFQPGVYIRGSSGVDQTSLIVQPFPPSLTEDQIAELFGSNLGAEEGLVPQEEFDGWKRWLTSLQGFTIDVAVRTFDDTQILVAFVSSELERDLLLTEVFEPVLLATAPR